MPWHDIHMMVLGDAVKDLVRHFIQYWNFAKVNIYDKDSLIHVIQLIPNQAPKGMRQTVISKFKKNQFRTINFIKRRYLIDK